MFKRKKHKKAFAFKKHIAEQWAEKRAPERMESDWSMCEPEKVTHTFNYIQFAHIFYWFLLLVFSFFLPLFSANDKHSFFESLASLLRKVKRGKNSDAVSDRNEKRIYKFYRMSFCRSGSATHYTYISWSLLLLVLLSAILCRISKSIICGVRC